ncbi:unnamed protein product [Dibothriocephalus latus]|uniref:BPTI/Kunitz inhibitor domain-containing protein n=1 Tax=Dibothriocephalus latus TaxID=60516 RepID=A0A3P7NZ87_DIBLA|nr:unnamed protein product [Dibothriocephalus latus]
MIFRYGGKGGNANRFPTKEDCEEAITDCAQEVEEDICKMLLDVGYGGSHFELFGYDKGARMCKKFLYGGEGGNRNAFETLQQCEEASMNCSTIEEEEDICQMPLEEGYGEVDFWLYGYDKNARICKQFLYGGVGGNRNAFQTLQQCVEASKDCPQIGMSCLGANSLFVCAYSSRRCSF